MKKIIAFLLGILFLFPILPLTKLRTCAVTSPRTWVVDDDGPLENRSIQEAINRADSGDLILVLNGTYYEDIALNKSVSLVGEDKDLVTIYGSRADYAVSITVDGTIVRGFTIRRTGTNPIGRGVLMFASDGVLEDNRITDVYIGLSLYYSRNNEINENIITGKRDGISLSFSSDNVFSGNVVSNNYNGINLYFSENNVFSGNVVSNNYDGANFYSSGGNLLYHNSFRNLHDTVHVSNESTNVWSSKGEGNYWADYTGPDSNNDGIGDSPYVVDQRNQDVYPLMGAFHDFSVVLRSGAYAFTIISNSSVSDFRFRVGETTGNKVVTFNVTGEENTVGFCRVMIPVLLMEYPISVFSVEEEIDSTLLSISNETYAYLYFTYPHRDETVTLISSRISYLYDELQAEYLRLQADLNDLNVTYNALLNEYNARQQQDVQSLNSSYSMLLDNYTALLGDYSELRQDYLALNSTHQEHLLDYDEKVQSIQNMVYLFAATTAIFLITTAYLSKRAHTSPRPKVHDVQD